MEITEDKLKEILVGPGHVEKAAFEAVAKEAEKEKIPLGIFLVEKKLISDENLGTIIASIYDYNFIDLKGLKISDEFLSFIPEAVARSKKAIVFRKRDKRLYIATSDPENYEFIKHFEKNTGYKAEVYYATPLGMEEALRYYKRDMEERVKNLIEDLEAHPESQENVVKLVDLLLEHAHDMHASDIHVEPLEKSVSVRFRVDGVLHEVATYPKKLHGQIVSRVKILSKLRIDEHFIAQDGRFEYQRGRTKFDARVSILPVTDGENVVMRLMSDISRRLTFYEVGLSELDGKRVRRAALKSYGMILSAGPAASGKTTTLYAILQVLNKPEVNIMTIEDPVEYAIEHVQQTNVNPKKNLTFATGLRAIVRQDPDIIMVGEIRDEETADIAISASMTGHMVLSSLNSNDAATTFLRLIDLGVEPFLISSSVNLVVAQRLVRRVCNKCKISYYLNKKEVSALKADIFTASAVEEIYKKEDFSKIRFYKGTGCIACNDQGYAGRIGIFEVMEVSTEIRKLIIEKASSDAIYLKAKELGMTSMLHDGIAKVFQGITTLEDVIKATKG